MEFDGVYSYVVLAASFVVMMIGPSLTYATGVFHVAMLEEFQEDLVLTTWVGSTFGCMFALSGPVASFIINVFDCRTCVVMSGFVMMIGLATSCLVTDIKSLFITFALVAGLGTGLAGTGTVVILGYYFPKHAVVASSICFTGAGFGIFVLPALVQFLLEKYGFHGAYLITGGITFHACAAGMLMRPAGTEVNRQRNALGGQTLRQKITLPMWGNFTRIVSVIQNVSFLLYTVSILCFSLGVSTQYQFVPNFFVTHGSSQQEASFVLSMSGIGGILSRILTGFAANDENIGSCTMHSSVNGIMAIFSLLITLFESGTHLNMIYGFILGLYTGGVWVLMTPLTLDLLDLQDFATGVGVVRFACGTGFLVGSPIAGAIVKGCGQYYSAFLFSGAMFFLASVFGFLSTLKTKASVPSNDAHLSMVSNCENATGVSVREALVVASGST
ncbi:monocarboxylate transporter 12-like [Haliotis rufescens]|uniref:monocarboxylate transporter 12-like n=1 Tax=Haliotis rufescens TaxID=6454 RepID=UPI00201F8DFB|nr:monocarboxylate transporter 12-like [Haliotis rufescens]